MSAESSLVMFGVQRELSDGDITPLEERTHPIVQLCRTHGLQWYWGNFGGGESQRYLLLIGKKLGVVGAEGADVFVPAADLNRLIAQTSERLQSAGINEPPALMVVWEPDT